MTKETVNVFDDVFQNFRKAAEANLKMQQEMFHQWTHLWPGLPSPQAVWIDKIRDFQKQWTGIVSDLARRHRDTLDRQYQTALESLDEALRFTEASNPDEFRSRSEQFFRKTLDCLREISETQMKEFQDAVSKWGELLTKTGR